MAELEEAISALRKADAAGNVEDAKALTKFIDSQLGGRNLVSQEGDLGRLQAPDFAPDFATGFPQGLRDVGNAATQMLSQLNATLAGVSPIANEEDVAIAQEAAESTNQRIAAGEEAFQQSRDPRFRGRPNPGRIGGQVAATAPLAAVPGAGAASLTGRLASGAVAGAGGATLAAPADPETKNFWRDKGIQALVGGAFGAGSVATGAGAGRVINPRSSPDVQALIREGVVPTPGQALGGVARNIEEKAKSIPLLGDAIRAAEGRARLDFNRGAVDRIVKPVGLKTPKDVAPGFEAVGWAKDALSGLYESLVPKMTLKVDKPFVDGFARVTKKVADRLSKNMQQEFDNIVKDVSFPSTSTRQWTGEDTQAVLSTLGDEGSLLKKSNNAAERRLGNLVLELRDEVNDAMTRSVSPDDAAQFINLNKAWKGFVRLETAAALKGTKKAVFTPNQFRSAVRSQDRSKRKGAFARGEAEQQEFAEAGSNVLGNKVPDSGTAGRLLLADFARGGATLLGSGGLAGVAALPFATRLGTLGMRSAVAGRQGPVARGLAGAARGAGRAGAPAAGVTNEEIIEFLRGGN